MDVGTIKVRLAFDESSINSAFADMEAKAKKFNSLLLTPKVDDSQLTALNKHFDLKIADHKKVERHFASNILRPRVDSDSLKIATRQFEQLRDVLKDIDRIQSKPARPTRSPSNYNTSDRSSSSTPDNSKLARDIGSEVSKAIRGSLISRIVGAPARAVASGIKAISTGLVEGATFQVSQRAGKGLSDSVEKALGGTIGSSELLASKLSDKFIAAIKGKLPKELTDELSASIREAIGAQDVIIDQAVEASNRRKTTKRKRNTAQNEIVEQTRDELRNAYDTQESRDNLTNRLQSNQSDQTKLTDLASNLQQKAFSFQASGEVPKEFTDNVLPELIESENKKNSALIENLKQKEFKYLTTLETINNKLASATDTKVIDRLNVLKSSTTEKLNFTQSSLSEIEKTIPTDSIDIQQSYNNYLDEVSASIYENLAALSEVEEQLTEQIAKADEQIKNSNEKVKGKRSSGKKIADPEIPEQYREIFSEVAGKNVSKSSIPKLVVDDAKLTAQNAEASYSPESNVVKVTSEFKAALEANALSNEQVATLMHELEHGIQFAFGSREGIDAARNNRSLNDLITPTQEEFIAVAPFAAMYDESKQGFEMDAEIRSRRKANSYNKRKESQSASKQAIAEFGIAGSKVEKVAAKPLTDALSSIQDIQLIANNVGIDVNEKFEELSTAIYGLSSRIQSGIGLITDIQIGKGNLELLQTVESAIGKQFTDLESILIQVEEFKIDALDLIKSRNKQSSNLAIADPWDENNSIVSRAGNAIAGFASSSMSAIGDSASELATTRINNQLSRVIGQPNTIDISARQINSLGELEFKDALKLATLGLVDLATLIHGVTKGGVRTVQAVEEGFLGALPGGKAAKAIGQELVLPAVFITAAQKVPVLAEITQTLVTSLQSMSMPFVEAGSQMIGAAGGEGVAGILSNAGFVGEKLATPLGGATSTALTALAESAGELAVQFGSVVVTGKAFGKALEMATPNAIKDVFSGDDSEQKVLPQGAQTLGKNVAELVYSEVSKKVAQLGQQAKSIQYLKPAESIEIAQKALKNVNQALPRAESELKALPPADRTGTRISSDYGNLTKAKKYLEDLIEETKKLLNSPVEAIENMVASFKSGDEQVDSSGYIAQMKNARKLFAEKTKEFNRTGDSELGAEIQAESARARTAIADLEQSLGNNVNKKLKDAISATRSALTKSENATKTPVSVDEDLSQLRVKNPRTPDEKIANAKESVQKYEGAINAANLKQTLAENNQQIAEATNNIKSYQEQIEAILAPGTLQFDDNGVLQLKESMDGLINSVPGLGGVTGFFENLKTVGTAVAAFTFLSTFQDEIISFGQASFDAALQYESFTTLLNNTSSSSGAVAASLDTINSTVSRLNINLAAARDGYVKLQASALGTELEGLPTDKIFGAVSQASSVYQLDEQSTERVYRAIEQMSSKGTVSAEELRQQLGESLPGAFQIASRSMGLTTKEFNKLLETGQITSSDFLPKFAAQLSAETNQGVAGAANSAQGSMNKLNNALLRLQETAGKPLLEGYRLGLQVLTPIVEYLPGVLTLTAAAVAALAAQLIYIAAKPVLSAAAGMLKLATSTTTVAGAMRVLMMQALKFGLWAGTATLVIGGLQTAFAMLNDKGGKAGEWLKTTTAGFKELADAIDKANGKLSRTGEITKKDLKNTGYSRDSVIGGILGKDLADKAEEFVQRTFRASDLIPGGQIAENIFNTVTGRKSEKKVSANYKAEAFEKSASQNVIEMQKILALANSQIDDAAEVSKLTREIEQKQLEAQGYERANPLDTTGIRQRNEEIIALTSARDLKNNPVGSAAKQYQTIIDTSKSALLELDEQMKNSSITTADYNRLVALNASVLEEAERKQKEFNNAVNDSNKQFSNAGIAIAKTIAQLEDYMSNSDFNKLTRDARISISQLNGSLTEGQAEYTKQLSDQVVLLQDIATKQQAIRSIKDQIGETNIDQVLAAFGLNRNTVGQAQLDAAKAQATTPQQKVALDAQSQILTLETELAGMTGQYYDTAAQLKQQIVETNKSIADYFRQALESFEDTKNAIAESNISAIATRTGNAIKRSVVKFQQSFATDLVDSIVSMIEIASRFALNALKEKTDISNALRELQQSQQSADEMRQGLVNGLSAVGGNPPQSSSNYSADPLTVYSGGRKVNKLSQVNDHHDYQTKQGMMVKDLVLADSSGRQEGVGVPSPVSGTAMISPTKLSGGYGNLVTILNDAGVVIARLAHLSSFAVKNNQRVNVGDVVGGQGNTGRSTGTHLHIEASKEALQNYIPMLTQGRSKQSVASKSGSGATNEMEAFARKAVQVANELGIKPEHLLGIIGAESNFNPKAVNRSSGATGLIQFMPTTANLLGTSTDKLKNMDRVDQLDYVKKFFQRFINEGANFKKLGVAGAYGAVFAGNPNASMGVRDNATSLGATIKRAETNYGTQIAQFMRAAGTVSQQVTSAVKSTQSLPNTDFDALAGVGANQLAQAQQTSYKQAQAKIADARNQRLLADDNDTLAMEQERAKFQQVIKDARRNMADESIRQVREQEDFMSSLGYSTPSKEVESQIREINRKFQDQTKDFTRGLEDQIEQRETLKIVIENIKKNPSLDPSGEALKGVNLTLNDVNKSIAATQEGLKTASSNRNKAIQDVMIKAADAEVKRVEAVAAQMGEISSQSLNAMADAAQQLLDINPDDYSKGDPIDFRLVAQQRDLRAAYDADLAATRDMVQNGERTAKEASDYYIARKELLDRDITNAIAQSNQEKRAAIEARDQRARERLGRLGERLTNSSQVNFDFAQEQNNIAATARETFSSSLRNSARNAPNSYALDLADNLDYQSRIAAINNETQAKLRDLMLEQAKTQSRLKEINDLNAIANKSPEQMARLQQLNLDASTGRSVEQIEKLIELTQYLDAQKLDNITAEYEGMVSDRTRERGRQLLDARGAYAGTLGLDVISSKFQKQAAIEDQNASYKLELEGLEDFRLQMGKSVEDVASLRQGIEDLNNVKLKNIEAEFNPFTQVLGEVQQGFASTISGVITGSQSLSEGLNNMLGSIAQSLANLAAQWITNELIGSLFGMGTGGGFGTTSSGFASVFSGLIGGYASGGEVQSDPGVSALRSLPGSIGKALTKEGSNSVLAALTPGERVLTISEAKLYNALYPTGIANSTRMPQISNFATGGMVGVSQGAYSNMGNTTVNVSVPIENSNADNIDATAIANAARKAVLSELATQTRPNGMLNRRR